VPEHSPSPLSLTLTYLRSAALWSKVRLARFLGHADESLISAYERGAKPLTREKLDALAESLGHPPEAVDVLLFAHGLIFPAPRNEAASPVALSPEENRVADRAAMAAGSMAGRIAAGEIRSELVRRWKQEKAEAARQEAEGLFLGLMAGTRRERIALVDAFPAYRSWALAVLVCEESLKRAAHKAEEALELAELAVSIAERVTGEESWRSRLKGYCWAHVANARRVANDLAGADEVFARAWDLWRAGEDSEPDLLAEWRLFSLEASLRRDERRLVEALKLLEQAQASAGSDPFAIARILLKRENVFLLMGDTQNALTVLVEAAPIVEASHDERLLFALRFKSAFHLCHLERYEEVAKLLPQVRELAVQQANELDLIRVAWLTAKVAAGQGQTEEAIAGLEQVSRSFIAREMPYDAALSFLDLSVVWLMAGRTAEVKALAVAMGWIFKAKGVQREALISLGVFFEAALQESATEALARRVMAEIERMSLSASPP
jgi:tetratricopeptide (TPR) repeat protein